MRHPLAGPSSEAPCFGREWVPAPTGVEAAAFDRRAIEASEVPASVLMENAGRAAAQVVARLVPEGRIAVVAGRGNNGGDAVVFARSLAAWGREVRLFASAERPRPEPLLHGHAPDPTPIPGSRRELQERLAGAAVVVDGLLGTGIRGAPREPQAEVIEAISASGLPVVALDVPSGVDSATGAAPGAAVRADVTVAFGAPKLGTLLHPGRALAGRLVAVEIGFPPWREGDAGARVLTREWMNALRPRRALRTHKNAEGRLLLLAGREGMAGAAVLAARAALRAGVGFLRIASTPGNRAILQSAVPEAPFVDATDPDALERAASASDALAAGPGSGTDAGTAEALDRILRRTPPSAILLDADALTLLGRGTLPAFAGAADPERRLLTPHPGELARMTAGEVAGILDAPLAAARDAARRWEAVCLLKGTPSVVAEPGGAPVRVSVGGGSDLARAGMGDVLTGAAGALLARGLGGADAASLALHLTGRAAARLRRGDALLPTDVAETLGAALGEEGSGDTDLGLPFVLLDLEGSR